MLYYFKAFFDYVWSRRSEWYAYMQQQGFFKDRDDPAAWDWAIGDLINDNAWHDLDLSAIVPEHAHAVLIRLRYRAWAVSISSYLRSNGKVNTYNLARFDSQVANVANDFNVVVQCDSNRVIEYRIAVPWVDRFNISIMGWWF